MAGENVAYGYPNGRAVVVAGGWTSRVTAPTSSSRGYRLMGVAARKGSNGLWYVAQVFGRRR